MEVWNWLALIGLLIVLRSAGFWALRLFKKKVRIEEFAYGWAVITGATDGIGKGLALELYHRGFNLILMSRNPKKLEAVKQEISQGKESPEIVCIPVDFSTCHHDPKQFFGELDEKLKGYDVSVLVNNVGIMNIGPLHKMAWKDLEEMTAVNIYPQTFLTRHLLPSMTSRYKASGRRSLVISLSSSAAILPMPITSLYGATKAYNDWLSRALSYEYEPAVLFVSFRPGVVETNLPRSANVKTEGLGVIDTTAFSKAAMDCLGERTCSPHWIHGLMAWSMENIVWPEFMVPICFWVWKKGGTNWDQGYKKSV